MPPPGPLDVYLPDKGSHCETGKKLIHVSWGIGSSQEGEGRRKVHCSCVWFIVLAESARGAQLSGGGLHGAGAQPPAAKGEACPWTLPDAAAERKR